MVSVYQLTEAKYEDSADSITYDGEEQELINAGTTTGGTMEYKLVSGNWTSDVSEIKASAAGNYTVYYRIKGGDNYKNLSYRLCYQWQST